MGSEYFLAYAPWWQASPRMYYEFLGTAKVGETDVCNTTTWNHLRKLGGNTGSLSGQQWAGSYLSRSPPRHSGEGGDPKEKPSGSGPHGHLLA